MLSLIGFCGFRSGTIVDADSSGNVQFWDGRLGTLLQARSYHKGDVNALAADPSHNRVSLLVQMASCIYRLSGCG